MSLVCHCFTVQISSRKPEVEVFHSQIWTLNCQPLNFIDLQIKANSPSLSPSLSIYIWMIEIQKNLLRLLCNFLCIKLIYLKYVLSDKQQRNTQMMSMQCCIFQREVPFTTSIQCSSTTFCTYLLAYSLYSFPPNFPLPLPLAPSHEL